MLFPILIIATCSFIVVANYLVSEHKALHGIHVFGVRSRSSVIKEGRKKGKEVGIMSCIYSVLVAVKTNGNNFHSQYVLFFVILNWTSFECQMQESNDIRVEAVWKKPRMFVRKKAQRESVLCVKVCTAKYIFISSYSHVCIWSQFIKHMFYVGISLLWRHALGQRRQNY